jgi:aryl-alcohol dehydrogenase-like predicted oxidoreductase
LRYRKFGKSDLKVSEVGLGALQFGTQGYGISDKEEMKKILNRSLELGVNFIDTAEGYGNGTSERIIGEVLKERGDRDDLILATKVRPGHLEYKNVIKAAEASLKRLQTNVIDLYQVHHPNCYVPVSETMRAMGKLLKDGKIRYVGVSNFPVCLTKESIATLEKGEIISNQLQYNILSRDIEKEIIPHLREEGVVTIAYSPLSGGLLTGKYDENFEFPNDDLRSQWTLLSNKNNRAKMKPIMQTMKEIAEKHETAIPQVAINWLLKMDDVFPIPGAKSVDQAESNAKASEWKMSDDEWRRITTASDKLELDEFSESSGW